MHSNVIAMKRKVMQVLSLPHHNTGKINSFPLTPVKARNNIKST